MSDALVIYGGTFDPVHLAHIELALYCQKYFEFQRLHVMPCALPAHKEQPLNAQHRLAMLHLAFAKHQHIVIDMRELQRCGPTYTIDTLSQLRAEEGMDKTIIFILGSDSWLSFDTWEQWQDILNKVNILIVNRPGALLPVVAHDHSLQLRCAAPQQISSMSQHLQCELQLRWVGDKQQFLKSPSGKIYKLEMPLMDISSSAIRAQLAAGESTENVLPPQVRSYIDEHCLYR